MNRRKGASLVELLAVMAVGSAVVGVAVAMIHTVLRTESAVRERLETRAAVSLLARQFRSDAHEADGFGPAGGEPSSLDSPWQFTIAPDHQVRYTPQPGRILREERIGGELPKREMFRLPQETSAVFERVLEHGNVVTLRLSPAAQTPESGRALRIEAWLGMNNRFARIPEVSP